MTTFTIPLLVVVFDKFKYSAGFGVFMIFLALITSGSYFRPQDFLNRQDSYFLNRYIPTPVASKDYLETKEEYLRLSKDTEVRPDRNYPLVSSENGDVLNVSRINDLDVLIEVNSKLATVINYNKYFYPGWTAKIDGYESRIEIGKPFGQILVNVPQGTHAVKIAFEETNFRKLLNAISLIAFLVSLGLIKNGKKYASF